MKKIHLEIEGRALAARLATGKAGGVPLPMLSRSAREGLKRPAVHQAPTERKPDPQTGAAARRLRQMQRQQAKGKGIL